MRLAVDTDPVVRMLQGRTWKSMTEQERQSLSRKLQLYQAWKEWVRRERIR